MVDRVCVSTVTWARDEGEQQLLRRSLLLLADAGLTIVVADRASCPAFSAFLASHPQFRVARPHEPSLVGQVQASLTEAAATGAEFILYTESDKALFFSDGLGPFLRRADLHREAGAVLAARSDAAFATFPPFQRYTERTINKLCARFIGTPGDYSYGPFLLNRELVPRLAGVPPEAGWGWRHFIFGSAARLGYTVAQIVGEYPCPPDQQHEGESERLHRLRQLGQNVQGLLLSMTPQKERG
jgi:hypothetical protein